MRFMVIRKSDKNSEAGAMPGEDLPSAGEPGSAVRLKPSSKGVRVMFSGGEATVIEGPFTEAKELVAGFTFIDAGSKEEAIELVKGWQTLGDDGEALFEIREAGCPGGVAGVRPSSPSGPPNQGSKEEAKREAKRGQFAVLLKTTEHSEAGFVSGEEVLAAMTRRNEESVKAGVMLAGEGLKTSSSGARVKLSKGKSTVIDGPFAEAKELIAGFWLIQAKSREEAIEWVKRYPFPLGPDGEGEVEVREVYQSEGI